MEMSPNQVRTASFASARKGWDPKEVGAFLERVAEALEAAQNHATAKEARARAAVNKLQEFSSADRGGGRPPASAEPSTAASTASPTDDQAETISRTLLLAQRAADEAVAEARAEAERIVDEARREARRVDSEERDRARSEVESLSARRDFLQSDVEQLENFLLDQRERLRTAAATLVEMAEQVPGGLGYLRPPTLSASDDDDTPSGEPRLTPGDELRITTLDLDDGAGEVRPGDRHAAGDPAGDPAVDTVADTAGDPARDPAVDAAGGPAGERPQGASVDAATQAMPAVDGRPDGGGDAIGEDDPTPEGTPLRFAPGVDTDADRRPGR